MTMPLYVGFSSIGADGTETRLTDTDLVIADLRNQFGCRLDEMVGRPRWGRIVHDLLFDLGDSRTQEFVVADVERIIKSDPRVRLIRLTPRVDLDGHSIVVVVQINVIEFDMNVQFSVIFTSRNN